MIQSKSFLPADSEPGAQPCTCSAHSYWSWRDPWKSKWAWFWRKVHFWPTHLYELGEHIIPDLSPLCSYSNLHFSLKAFHWILEHGCGGSCSLKHKSITEIWHWCCARKLGVQYVFQFTQSLLVGLRSGLCAKHSICGRSSLHKPCIIVHKGIVRLEYDRLTTYLHWLLW